MIYLINSFTCTGVIVAAGYGCDIRKRYRGRLHRAFTCIAIQCISTHTVEIETGYSIIKQQINDYFVRFI